MFWFLIPIGLHVHRMQYTVQGTPIKYINNGTSYRDQFTRTTINWFRHVCMCACVCQRVLLLLLYIVSIVIRIVVSLLTRIKRTMFIASDGLICVCVNICAHMLQKAERMEGKQLFGFLFLPLENWSSPLTVMRLINVACCNYRLASKAFFLVIQFIDWKKSAHTQEHTSHYIDLNGRHTIKKSGNNRKVLKISCCMCECEMMWQ